MANLADRVGFRTKAYVEVVDGKRALEYAAATNDHGPWYEAGDCVPPVFAVVPTGLSGVEVVRAVLPESAWTTMLHISQDMHFKEVLVPGQRLSTVAEAQSVRSSPAGTLLCTRVVSENERGRCVLEMYSTVLVPNLSAGAAAGPSPPDHRLTREDRHSEPVTATVSVDHDQTFRYAPASGDFMPVHLDADAAREMGMPGIILHGMCGVAMCGSAVLNAITDGDPRRLRRLAVRFVRPVFPGSDLEVAVFRLRPDAGHARYGFTARSDQRVVMNDGRVEIDI